MYVQRRFVLVGMFLAGTVVAGCAGGSSPAPNAQPTATANGASIASLNAVPTTAGTVALPAVGGITPSFGILAGAPAGLTVSTVESLSAPSGAPAIESLRRKAASAATATPFLFINVTFSAAVPAGVLASEVLNLVPSLVQNVNYFLEIDDITSGSTNSPITVEAVAPATVVVTFANSGITFAAGHTYLFQFYSLPIPGPTPTPTATPTSSSSASPSPSPSPSTSASPTPSPTPSPTAFPTTTPTPTPTQSPTPIPSSLPLYTFTGPSVSSGSVTPPTQPTVEVPAQTSGGYGTYVAHATFAFGAETTTAPFALTVALGSAADITSPGYPFYTGSAATPLFYVQVSSTVPVSFAQTPMVTVTTSSFPSSNSCSLYLYGNPGSGYLWAQVPGTLANVNGNSVTIPSVTLPAGTVNFSATSSTPAFIGC